MSLDRDLYKAVDYILNRADARDLEVIKAALERRAQDAGRRLSPGNLRGMAREIAGAVSGQLDSIGDVKEMTLRYVREMVRRTLPSIPEEHLNLLLEEWVPGRSRAAEANLPPDVVRSMVVQFVDYSLGRMSASDRAELRDDWSKRYWSVFSERTRSLIRELLMGGITERQFWTRLDEEDK